LNNKIYINKIESIQLIRGLAALGVVLLHTLVNSRAPFSEVGIESYIIFIIKGLGSFAIDIFFIISGFIMGSIISKSSTGGMHAMMRFLILRIFRIYPLYWITIAAAILIPIYLMPNLLGAENRSVEISQIILNHYSPLNPVTWTLAYEVRFYLIASIAIFFGAKAKEFLITWGVLQITWVIMTTLKFLPAIDIFSDALSLEFIIGILIAYVPIKWRFPIPRILAITALIASMPMLHFFTQLLGDIDNGWSRLIGSGVPAAIVVTSAIYWNRAGIKTPKPFIFLGNISYSIYMWHWILFMFTMTWFGSIKDTHLGFHFFLFAEIGITIAVSFLSYRLIEIPFINYSHLLNKKYLK